MANVCTTQWALKGEEAHLEAIHGTIKEMLGQTPPPRRPELREFLEKLDIKIPEDTDTAAEIISTEMKEEAGVLLVATEEAWDPKTDAMNLLKERFPGLVILFEAENFEDDIYLSNDTKGEIFSSRYALDLETDYPGDMDPVEYFQDEEELLDYIESHFGYRPADADEVVADLEDVLSDMYPDNSFWFSLHEKQLAA